MQQILLNLLLIVQIVQIVQSLHNYLKETKFIFAL